MTESRVIYRFQDRGKGSFAELILALIVVGIGALELSKGVGYVALPREQSPSIAGTLIGPVLFQKPKRSDSFAKLRLNENPDSKELLVDNLGKLHKWNKAFSLELSALKDGSRLKAIVAQHRGESYVLELEVEGKVILPFAEGQSSFQAGLANYAVAGSLALLFGFGWILVAVRRLVAFYKST